MAGNIAKMTHCSGLKRKQPAQCLKENPVQSSLDEKQKTRTWEADLAVLATYKEKHGDCNVLQDYREIQYLHVG
jgi:hypothetical protein